VEVAVAFSMDSLGPDGENADGGDRGRGMLAAFRGGLYRCLTRRADALFEVADAVLCEQDRVHMLAELSLEPECRRSHGAPAADTGNRSTLGSRQMRAFSVPDQPAYFSLSYKPIPTKTSSTPAPVSFG
jgi:hypothetical protein